MNQSFTGIFTALGNSKAAFLATTSGLIVNIILDPVLIFGLGPFPAMRIMGAAVATVIAQAIVTLTFLIFATKDTLIFPSTFLRKIPDAHTILLLL